jgi:hypothetical protein
VGVTFGYIQRSYRAWVAHQMQHMSRAPHSVKSHFSIVPIYGTQTPQCIVKPIALQDRRQSQRFVISGCLVQVAQQFCPATAAR